MPAPRALTTVIASGMLAVLAACTNPTASTPSPSAVGTLSAATPLSTTPPTAPATSLPGSPAAEVDLAALRIAAPYDLVRPSSTELGQLSGQIRGMPGFIVKSAGAGYGTSDFPMGVRFIRSAGSSVGVVVLFPLPSELAERAGLFDAVAAAAAAIVNAPIAYETIDGVKVGVIRGPIASTLALLHGHLVFVQTGQPAVDPKDLLAAIIAANDTFGS